MFADGNADRLLQPSEHNLRSGNAGPNVTFTLCDKRGAKKATALVLANNERVRESTPTMAAATACIASMR